MPFLLSSSTFALVPSRRRATVGRALVCGALWTFSPACDAPSDLGDDAIHLREQWSKDDDPDQLGKSFTYEFDALPNYGRTDRTPWPGSYWPAYQDSINYRWDGPKSRSPAAKYGEAFGKSWIEDRISEEFGVDSIDGKSCSSKSDCDEHKMCARRRGEKQGRCVVKWYGICDGWAPAAILEPEPQRAVVYNGVRFEIPDLKALVSLTYTEGVSLRHVSLRCDYSDTKYDLGDTKACVDTNPGTFHVAVTNLVGLRQQALIMDRTYDVEVWNHPIIEYQVTRDNRISAETANDLLGVGGSDYYLNDDAAELRRVRMLVRWVSASMSEADGTLADQIDWYAKTAVYDYILELDDDGRIIGGEWLYDSRTNHPDFLWIPTDKHDSTVAGVKYSDVKELLLLAQE